MGKHREKKWTRFADDIAILAENEEKLLKTLKMLDLVMITRYTKKINKNKTEVTLTCIQGTTAHLAPSGFCVYSKQGDIWSTELERPGRTNQAKANFNNKKKLVTPNSISFEVRKRLVTTFEWSVML